jgi:hypothetical protein
MLWAQEVPRLQLKVKESLPVAPLVRSIAYTGAQCDGKGNVYYHPAMEAPANPMSGPLVRISADGHQVVNIGLDSAPDFPKGTPFNTFALGLRGEVHILVYKHGEPYLVNFNDDGDFESVAGLEGNFAVTEFAVFPTGELLIAGARIPEGRGRQKPVPFTAIFDRNGIVLKELRIESDVQAKPGSAPEADSTLESGQAVPADDGNIYLMRSSQKPSIVVISPAGEIVRRVRLTPPSDFPQPGNFGVGGGKIAMSFFRPTNDERHSGTYLYSLYDAETGEREMDFVPAAEAGGDFLCYSPNQFTLFGWHDDGLDLVHAAPR